MRLGRDHTALAPGLSVVVAGARARAIHPSRTFELGQLIRYGYSAPVRHLHQRLRTIPPPRYAHQHRQRWRLAVSGADHPRTEVSFDAFANLVIETTAARVDGAVEFELELEVKVEDVGPIHRTSAGMRYLSPTHLTSADESVAELATAVKGGDVGLLCARVHQALDYEWGVTDVSTTAAEALAGGSGVCQDYAHIMLAACRHAGLPARYVSGHLPGEGGSHAWIEVLHPQIGRRGSWIAEGWDPTHNRRTNSDYLVIAVGRDYADVAPLSGTFVGDGVTSTLSVDKRFHVT